MEREIVNNDDRKFEGHSANRAMSPHAMYDIVNATEEDVNDDDI